MNNPHHGASLTVCCREQIVTRIVAGQSAPEVAKAFAVSMGRVRKWLARHLACGSAELSNHASTIRLGGRLPAPVVRLVLHLRRSLQMTGAAIRAGTVHRGAMAQARGIGTALASRPVRICAPLSTRAAGRAYPPDIKKVGRFGRPGHRNTGRIP